MKDHRIVVGVDGSDASSQALAWALHEAHLRSAALEVVLAWSYPPVPSMTAFGSIPLTDFEAAANATIAELVARVGSEAEAADVELIPRAVMDSPAGALLSASTDADLLVVGSRGRGELKGLLLGSVGQHCATHAHGAVAIVPPSGARETDAGTGTGRVIVGVDGSPGSNAALRWAMEDATLRETSVVALLAYSYLAPYGPLGSIAFEPDYSEADAVAALEAIVTRVASASPEVEIERRVVCDLPAPALHRAAGPDDVIVIGARGLGGFKGLLLGSVSLKTATHAACPVVIVHQPEPDQG